MPRRAPRRVQPEIDTRGKHRREPPFIVFQVNDLERVRLQPGSNFENFLDQLLPRFIMRMSLAAEENLQAAELFRTAYQPLGIRKQQVGSFIGGHAAGKADGEDVAAQRDTGPLLNRIDERAFG